MDTNSTGQPQQMPNRNFEVGEDSRITFKVKDLIAIASFLIYVGISIAGYFFAREKLTVLDQGNAELQQKVIRLEEQYKINAEILKKVETQVDEVKDILMKK